MPPSYRPVLFNVVRREPKMAQTPPQAHTRPPQGAPQANRADRKRLLAAKNHTQQLFNEGLSTLLDLIAPASLVVTPNYLKLGSRFVRTLFVYTYPRYIQTNWLSEV